MEKGLIEFSIWEYDLAGTWDPSMIEGEFDSGAIFFSNNYGVWDNVKTEEFEEEIPLENFDLLIDVGDSLISPTVIVGCKYAFIGEEYPEQIVSEISNKIDVLIN